MAKKIQAWTAYGPKIELDSPMTKSELIENIVLATNQSKGSVLAVLAELDVQIEAGLKAGRIVQLPNGTHFEPIGKKDGKVNIGVRVNPELDKQVNAGFRGKWVNSENIGKTEAEMIAHWNSEHPNDLILTDQSLFILPTERNLDGLTPVRPSFFCQKRLFWGFLAPFGSLLA